jgi:hypothetical protein
MSELLDRLYKAVNEVKELGLNCETDLWDAIAEIERLTAEREQARAENERLMVGLEWIQELCKKSIEWKPDNDPTPYCHVCNARSKKECTCPDPFYAENH